MKRSLILIIGILIVGSLALPKFLDHAHDFSYSPIERIAEVQRVVDGDTLILSSGERIRLVGINTPEIGAHAEAGGAEALEFVSSLLPPGTQVGINVDDLRPKDKYGRTLAVVFVRKKGQWCNLNAKLLQLGLAEPFFVPPSEFNPYRWLC